MESNVEVISTPHFFNSVSIARIRSLSFMRKRAAFTILVSPFVKLAKTHKIGPKSGQLDKSIVCGTGCFFVNVIVSLSLVKLGIQSKMALSPCLLNMSMLEHERVLFKVPNTAKNAS